MKEGQAKWRVVGDGRAMSVYSCVETVVLRDVSDHAETVGEARFCDEIGIAGNEEIAFADIEWLLDSEPQSLHFEWHILCFLYGDWLGHSRFLSITWKENKL
jgi:hypothetical protein